MKFYPDVFCKECGAHMLIRHPHHFEIYMKADGRGHAQVPGGNCPDCGAGYDLNDENTIALQSKKAKKELKIPKPPSKISHGTASTENTRAVMA